MVSTSLLCLAALPVLMSRLRTSRDITDLTPPAEAGAQPVLTRSAR